MQVTSIPERYLADRSRRVSVSMLDSGFMGMPSYAVMHGPNPDPGHRHGNRMLSIFTALDGKWPHHGISLHLACYRPSDGYAGLEKAISMLPHTDILSLSLAWRDDVPSVMEVLRSKADVILVPMPNTTSVKDPAAYAFTSTCCNGYDANANWCLSPNPAWKGNSYAVPAMARILCHGNGKPLAWEGNAISVQEMFSSCGSYQEPVKMGGKPSPIVKCMHCRHEMRDPYTSRPMDHIPEKCPYCGRKMQKI